MVYMRVKSRKTGHPPESEYTVAIERDPGIKKSSWFSSAREPFEFLFN